MTKAKAIVQATSLKKQPDS